MHFSQTSSLIRYNTLRTKQAIFAVLLSEQQTKKGSLEVNVYKDSVMKQVVSRNKPIR